ncbi:hypothetical protein QOT17_013035 [Balamuthia mandrillaris]
MNRTQALLFLCFFFVFATSKLTTTALEVGLFSDPRYTNQFDVPTEGQRARGSPVMLEALLDAQEHTIHIVDDLKNATLWNDVLSRVSVFVIPELELQQVIDKRVDGEDESITLPPALINALVNSFVGERGGILVWTSNGELFNETFQLNWQQPSFPVIDGIDGEVPSGQNFTKTNSVEGTHFDEAPEELEYLDGIQAPIHWEWEEEQDTCCYYALENMEGERECAVLSMMKGSGLVVYLVWDYNSFEEIPKRKRDFITVAWAQVFDIAVEGPWDEIVVVDGSNDGEEGSGEEDGENSDEDLNDRFSGDSYSFSQRFVDTRPKLAPSENDLCCGWPVSGFFFTR